MGLQSAFTLIPEPLPGIHEPHDEVTATESDVLGRELPEENVGVEEFVI